MRQFLLAAIIMLAACGPEEEAPTPIMTDATITGGPAIVIAHRGASGPLPEHTIAAYELAIEQKADFIEPDLVLTKDGVLIARHDRYLSTTTDIADHPEFADRRTTKLQYGEPREDWWAEDFTLAEIKTLRARQPLPSRGTGDDGRFEIPTFEEVIAVAKAGGVGVYPETKQPGALAALGFDMEAALLAALETAGWTGAAAPVYVQSFEPEILISLNEKIDVPLVQLVYAIEADGGYRSNLPLADIPAYADGVGAEKSLLVDDHGELTDFIARAHALGLFVHAWTFRDDVTPPDGAPIDAELRRVYAAGVDGVFADFPATAVEVRDAAPILSVQ